MMGSLRLLSELLRVHFAREDVSRGMDAVLEYLEDEMENETLGELDKGGRRKSILELRRATVRRGAEEEEREDEEEKNAFHETISRNEDVRKIFRDLVEGGREGGGEGGGGENGKGSIGKGDKGEEEEGFEAEMRRNMARKKRNMARKKKKKK